jgi:hypothetical protein
VTVTSFIRSPLGYEPDLHDASDIDGAQLRFVFQTDLAAVAEFQEGLTAILDRYPVRR